MTDKDVELLRDCCRSIIGVLNTGSDPNDPVEVCRRDGVSNVIRAMQHDLSRPEHRTVHYVRHAYTENEMSRHRVMNTCTTESCSLCAVTDCLVKQQIRRIDPPTK